MNALDACVILHKKELVGRVLMAVNDITVRAGMQLRVLLLVSSTGSADLDYVKTVCTDLGLEPLDCQSFDDRYLDFSGYGVGANFFSRSSSEGILFVNDTFASKHDCSHLRSEMARLISLLQSTRFEFPVLIGPYRHSEFSVLHGEVDSFVATFIFYLNTMGAGVLENLVSQLSEFERQLLMKNEVQSDALNAALLRFCQVHALQLKDRYIGPDSDALLMRKLTTAFAERMITYQIKRVGVVWFAAAGFFGRALVPLQQYTRRLMEKLVGRSLS